LSREPLIDFIFIWKIDNSAAYTPWLIQIATFETQRATDTATALSAAHAQLRFLFLHNFLNAASVIASATVTHI
jgi:hypothetical protein